MEAEVLKSKNQLRLVITTVGWFFEVFNNCRFWVFEINRGQRTASFHERTCGFLGDYLTFFKV